MFCENCGSEVPAGSVFCQNCGVKAETDSGYTATPVNTVSQPVFQQAPPPASTLYTQQPVISQPINYTAPMPSPKPKKRHVGLWVFLSILVISIASVVAVLGKALWSGPKDLGMKYTQADFNNVIQELGIHITADLGDGKEYDNKDILAGNDTATGYFSKDGSKTIEVKKMNANDFNWEFSKYEKKTIEMTDLQATAFFNEMGLSDQFLWLTDTQIKIESDGSVKMSSSLNIRSMIQDLFQDVFLDFSDKIPFILPEKLNIYLEGPGKFSIINNTVSKVPKKVSSSVYTIPDDYLTDKYANEFVSYFTDLFQKLNFDIYVEQFYVKNGNFFFTGTIPTEVKIIPKSAN